MITLLINIFVKVHLSENRMSKMNGKIEKFRGSDKPMHMSGGYNSKTLSGYEAANEGNN